MSVFYSTVYTAGDKLSVGFTSITQTHINSITNNSDEGKWVLTSVIPKALYVDR